MGEFICQHYVRKEVEITQTANQIERQLPTITMLKLSSEGRVLEAALKFMRNQVRPKDKQERPLLYDLVYSRPKSQWCNANHQAKIMMQMLNDWIVANRMPSRVSEIRVDHAYSGYHRRGPLHRRSQMRNEVLLLVVVNQVGDVYRSVRSERFVMLFDGRNFVCEMDVGLRRKGGVNVVGGGRRGFQDRFSTA